MDTGIIIAGAIYWAVTWTALGCWIGRLSGAAAGGFFLGLFLGPLGCALALFFNPPRPPQPHPRRTHATAGSTRSKISVHQPSTTARVSDYDAATMRDYEKWRKAHPQLPVR